MDRLTARQRDHGFTLIELLVVMIVIGILAAIAVPALLSSRQRAYETSAKADAKQIVQRITSALVDGQASSVGLTQSGSTWTLTTVVDGTGESSTGELSPKNGLSTLAWSALTPDVYCVTVVSGQGTSWSASPDGLFRGSSCA